MLVSVFRVLPGPTLIPLGAITVKAALPEHISQSWAGTAAAPVLLDSFSQLNIHPHVCLAHRGHSHWPEPQLAVHAAQGHTKAPQLRRSARPARITRINLNRVL